MKPGEFINMDLCGKMTDPFPVRIILLYLKMIAFRFAYYIKHKSNVLSKFTEFHKLIEKQTGTKLKRVRQSIF